MTRARISWRRAWTGRHRAFADERGAALIEMAVALPMLVVLISGILTFGSWIGLAHAVQQSANEGARAALAGLSVEERSERAQATVSSALRRSYNLDPGKVAVTVQDDGDELVVEVAYDATHHPLMALAIVPLPGTRIERRAVVRLAGL